MDRFAISGSKDEKKWNTTAVRLAIIWQIGILGLGSSRLGIGYQAFGIRN
jgi:hypothetical protein